MMEGATGACWYCHSQLEHLDYGRADTCKKCGRDTRVCKNCEFYDKNYNNECRESQADRTTEKEKSNFCDYFKPTSKVSGSAGAERTALKSAAEALFKKKT